MLDTEIIERLTHVEDRAISNTNRLESLEKRYTDTEIILKNLDKSLCITMQQIKNIAEDLKQTSVNFKEAVMRSNVANAKETELLKEKCNELDRKIDKVNEKLEQETTVKDAENWRSSKKEILSWTLNAILVIIATALGISNFM